MHNSQIVLDCSGSHLWERHGHGNVGLVANSGHIFGQILDFYWSKPSHLDPHWSAVVRSAMIDREGCVVNVYLLIVVSILNRRHGPTSYKGSGVIAHVVYVTFLSITMSLHNPLSNFFAYKLKIKNLLPQ